MNIGLLTVFTSIKITRIVFEAIWHVSVRYFHCKTVENDHFVRKTIVKKPKPSTGKKFQVGVGTWHFFEKCDSRFGFSTSKSVDKHTTLIFQIVVQ